MADITRLTSVYKDVDDLRKLLAANEEATVTLAAENVRLNTERADLLTQLHDATMSCVAAVGEETGVITKPRGDSGNKK